MKSVVVATAGHIDHGKSALVRALTGINPDRLEEEQRRGITIDLGFAHLDLDARTGGPVVGGRLPSGSAEADNVLRIGFVDVPGHERFVRNMLAGIGGIDVVLLVVAADESIKPQTREHLAICELQGVQRGIVVLTKADLVDPEILELVRLELGDFLRGSFLENAPVIAVSSVTASGLDQLRAELIRLAKATLPRPADAPMRLPIDRVFTMKGFGTVVTGTLNSGTIHPEDEVEVLGLWAPEGRRLRVRGTQVHGGKAAAAVAGQRTAVNLGGVEVRELARGMCLAEAGLFRTTDRIDVELKLLPQAPPLKDRSEVHFHAFSAETIARVLLLEDGPLQPGGRAYAQLRLAEPLLLLPGDRFVVRRFSPVTTIGGGRVIDNLAPRHGAALRSEDGARGERIRGFLQRLENATVEERILLLTERAAITDLDFLAAATGVRTADLRKLAGALAGLRKLVCVPATPMRIVNPDSFQKTKVATVQAVDDFHREQPLVEGIAIDDLAARVARAISGMLGTLGRAAATPPEVFRTALDELSAEAKIQLSGDLVKRAGRQIALAGDELAARDGMESAFRSAGLRVPALKEVLASVNIEPRRADKILNLLLREHVLVKVSDELVFHQSAMDELRHLLQRRKSAAASRINVAQFKELTGVSRKYAIPLLEYLDRSRVTRRIGDEREIL